MIFKGTIRSHFYLPAFAFFAAHLWSMRSNLTSDSVHFNLLQSISRGIRILQDQRYSLLINNIPLVNNSVAFTRCKFVISNCSTEKIAANCSKFLILMRLSGTRERGFVMKYFSVELKNVSMLSNLTSKFKALANVFFVGH